MNYFIEKIKKNYFGLCFTFVALIMFSLCCVVFIKNVTYTPTLSYTITDKIMYTDGECQFRSRWSSGYARTDHGDYFSCKEENTMVGYTNTIKFTNNYTFREYNGIVPWYGKTDCGILSFLGMIGFFCMFVFGIVRTKETW